MLIHLFTADGTILASFPDVPHFSVPVRALVKSRRVPAMPYEVGAEDDGAGGMVRVEPVYDLRPLVPPVSLADGSVVVTALEMTESPLTWDQCIALGDAAQLHPGHPWLAMAYALRELSINGAKPVQAVRGD